MKTNFKIYSTRGLDTIGRNVVYTTLQNSQQEAQTHPLFLAAKNELEAYSPLVLKPARSGMSEAENAALLVVQSHYKRLQKMVDAHALFPETEKGKAAVALQAVFKRAGKLYDVKKGDAVSSVENLVAEFAKPEMAAHIATLGLTTEAEELRTAKTEFNNVAGQRLNVKSELRQTDSASIGRKKLEKALGNYLRFVTAMRGVEGWEDLYSDLNEVMKAARLAIRQGKEPVIITDEPPAVP
ncbi:MAG: DUF6261 family protein [Bacteroidia bacterium]|nr:DUF6261 family protein [Bacteroidia bacterium]